MEELQDNIKLESLGAFHKEFLKECHIEFETATYSATLKGSQEEFLQGRCNAVQPHDLLYRQSGAAAHWPC